MHSLTSGDAVYSVQLTFALRSPETMLNFVVDAVNMT